jgi:glycerate kinase
MRLLVAPDSFKGTLRASEVCAAVARGIEAAGLEPPDSCPLADGGEGTMEALLLALGGETAGATARDPLGREVRAGFALLEDGGTAVVEVAAASGLGLVDEDQRDAEAATSHGTGDLIAAAIDAGAQVVLVGVGGSATTDGGAGAIEALDDAGGTRGARIVVLADVRTPFERAAAVFAPQKGADAAAVRRLSRRLERFAGTLPRDPRGVPMSGAAGGISGGLWAAFGARLEPGAPFVLDAVGYDERARAAFAVVLGEGRLDETTLHGKAVFEAATRARQMGVPAHAIVGRDDLDPFGKRIMDLQHVLTATDAAELETAGARLARLLAGETRPG